MDTSEELRRQNLLILIDEVGGEVELSEMYGCTESYIRQMKLGSKDSKTGKPKGVGNATARKLEDCTGKPRGWMDQPHKLSGTGATSTLAPTIGGTGYATPPLPQEEESMLAYFRALPEKERMRALVELEYKAKLAALDADAPPMGNEYRTAA